MNFSLFLNILVTTAFVTSDQPITTAALSTASSTAYFTSGATAPFTTSSSTSTKGVSTTTKAASGRILKILKVFDRIKF